MVTFRDLIAVKSSASKRRLVTIVLLEVLWTACISNPLQQSHKLSTASNLLKTNDSLSKNPQPWSWRGHHLLEDMSTTILDPPPQHRPNPNPSAKSAAR